MEPSRKHWIAALVFTGGLIGLISLAVTEQAGYFLPVMLVTVIGSAGIFYTLFPGSRFFSVAFANFLAVYACIFIFFMEANFRQASESAMLAGFLLPVLAFLAGAWWRRISIRRIVTAEHLRDRRHMGRVFLWLAPVWTIGAGTFLLPDSGLSQPAYDGALLAAMGGIAGIVFAVSRDVSTFLLDAGVVFEQFFHRITRLVLPAFAFLTFYSLIVIVFGCIYRIIDRFSPAAHFLIHEQARDITFPEALYFSIVTLSTVGYGDIVPNSGLVQIIVTVQIVVGILLLLFGFREIAHYSDKNGTP